MSEEHSGDGRARELLGFVCFDKVMVYFVLKKQVEEEWSKSFIRGVRIPVLILRYQVCERLKRHSWRYGGADSSGTSSAREINQPGASAARAPGLLPTAAPSPASAARTLRQGSSREAWDCFD